LDADPTDVSIVEYVYPTNSVFIAVLLYSHFYVHGSIWNEIINSCVSLADTNAQDVFRQLEFSGVTYVQGFASFEETSTSSPHSIMVDMGHGKITEKTDNVKIIKAEKVLIATGSKPFIPEGIPFDGVRIFDSDSINQLSFLPKSIVITGSGIIAVEYAKIFNNLGADVTLVIRDNVPRNALMKIGLDKDIAATLVADLVRSGIHIERGAQVSSFQIPQSNRAAIKVTLEGSKGTPRPRGCVTEVMCVSSGSWKKAQHVRIKLASNWRRSGRIWKHKSQFRAANYLPQRLRCRGCSWTTVLSKHWIGTRNQCS
jgi:pyruvate/2-oxoglutarate dehydrogenase complex dihydrolipoamide dehydrogenase (E3) component